MIVLLRSQQRQTLLNMRAEAGMTLLEVLVVMVILAMIATLGGLQLMNYLGRAKTDTARLQIQEIATAIELFRIDVGRPPSTEEGLRSLIERPVMLGTWRGPYLRRASNTVDPWGRTFLYRSPAEQVEFEVYSLGGDGAVGGDGEKADVSSR